MDLSATTDQTNVHPNVPLIAGRYRPELLLAASERSELWRAADQLAGEAPVALRRIPAEQEQLQNAFRSLWPRLQGVLHPQVPRFGELIEQDGSLWLPCEWQDGSSYAELFQGRRERQLVFGAGEVLLLLRQLLPALAVLHSQGALPWRSVPCQPAAPRPRWPARPPRFRPCWCHPGLRPARAGPR